jgi:hypothetical protein
MPKSGLTPSKRLRKLFETAKRREMTLVTKMMRVKRRRRKKKKKKKRVRRKKRTRRKLIP